MPFLVTAYHDERVLMVSTETAQEAFAIAVEWHVVERRTNISISDGVESFKIGEFSLFIAKLRQN